MKLSAFRFNLPLSYIALHPVEHRDEARLMVVHRSTGKIEHTVFKDIVKYFEPDDLIIINDTKVFPARLNGNKEKTGAKIEVFLLRELKREMRLWDVLVDPARKIRVGNKLFFGDGQLVAEVIDNTTSRGRTIRFLYDGEHDDFFKLIEDFGVTPMPKEIKRPTVFSDKERFQTVYAKNVGAVTAPAAGLHFTTQLMKKLELNGVTFAPITLHISLESLETLEIEDITKFRMPSENYVLHPHTTDLINKSLQKKERKICSVGISTLKTLESSVSANDLLKTNTGWTDKFIYPPFDFKISNALLTNFHLQKSAGLMTVSAFGGYELIKEAYHIAIKEKYRFFSYGDAMLII